MEFLQLNLDIRYKEDHTKRLINIQQSERESKKMCLWITGSGRLLQRTETE